MHRKIVLACAFCTAFHPQTNGRGVLAIKYGKPKGQQVMTNDDFINPRPPVFGGLVFMGKRKNGCRCLPNSFPIFYGAKSTNYRCALYVFRSDCLFKPGVGFL